MTNYQKRRQSIRSLRQEMVDSELDTIMLMDQLEREWSVCIAKPTPENLRRARQISLDLRNLEVALQEVGQLVLHLEKEEMMTFVN